MSVVELMKNVGKTVLADADGVKFEAKIVDVKIAYGQIRYLIEPVAGAGQKWVQSVQLKK